jgi:hypothetical protein
MQQIFATRAVALSRACDFVAETRQTHYIIELRTGFAVCDAEGLEPHRPATYTTVARSNGLYPLSIL